MKPLALYGGTFDPIHLGHLRTALEVGEALGGVEVRLLPAGRPPLREGTGASVEQRRRMVELAIEGIDGLALDDRELRREGPSYMVDTLAELRTEIGERPLCLILGMDAFAGLERWHRWPRLIELAHLVVMSRPGHRPPLEGPVAGLLAEHRVDLHEALARHPAGGILEVAVSGLEISASAIRRRLRTGHDIRLLLPEAVRAYIIEHGLYRH
ncbi:nicotinate-nucleotide adenylyltransferase [Endothiovibrio diazotrophicus]